VGFAGVPAPIHDRTATVSAPAYALSGADGQIQPSGMDGLFVADVRVLSAAVLSLGGTPILPLAQVHEGPGRTRFVGAAVGLGDTGADPTVRVDRLRVVRSDGMQERIRVSSTAGLAVAVIVTVELACDLTPLETVKTNYRPQVKARTTADGLMWSDAARTVTVTAPEADVSTEPPSLAWTVNVSPGQAISLQWMVRSTERAPVIVAPSAPIEWERPYVRAAEPRLGRLLDQSLDDLAALRLAEAGHPDDTFIGAGVPWFLTLFGRDSLWAARMMLPLGTGLAQSTLRALARRQGTRIDVLSGEEPGKILHELRRDDIWHRENAEAPVAYYATVDATLLWISLLADAWRWGMPEATVAMFLGHLDRALGWMEPHADADGFVRYVDVTGRGMANQGWRDSGGAIRFHDGSIARPPIALCEVQGYAYRAALDAAALLDAFDRGDGARRWRDHAAALGVRFRERFWVGTGPQAYPALALDADGRPVDSLTSSIGHLLDTGILSRPESASVAGRLLSEPLAGGYGLRTMSTLDAAYSPLAYHCGAVWPHDTAIALTGLAACGADGTPGADEAALRLVRGLLDAAEAFDYRLPELYGGDGRAEIARPVPHPAACRPQAWSATAGIAVLQAALGLAVDVPARQVSVRPLPGLGAIHVRGLRAGEHSFEVRVDDAGAAEISGLPETFRHRNFRHSNRL
jgi:glycogen debranching enzyme